MMILVTLSVTIYGMADITFNGTGPIGALRETASYLYRFPGALRFYSLLIVGYMIANILVIFLVSPCIDTDRRRIHPFPAIPGPRHLPGAGIPRTGRALIGLLLFPPDRVSRQSTLEEGTDSDSSVPTVEEPAPAPAETDETAQE
ncbi:MAG: hypothetical protein MZV70_59440 [Desulfobacterales bacterium]|nr:hypothetical protein [Desulfobacterales bacterium]